MTIIIQEQIVQAVYTQEHNTVIKHFMVLDLTDQTGDLQIEIIDANDEDPIVISDTIYPEITDANAYKPNTFEY